MDKRTTQKAKDRDGRVVADEGRTKNCDDFEERAQSRIERIRAEFKAWKHYSEDKTSDLFRLPASGFVGISRGSSYKRFSKEDSIKHGH